MIEKRVSLTTKGLDIIGYLRIQVVIKSEKR